MFSEVAEIALVAARLGQFPQLLKTRVILILNFTRPHAITYTKFPVDRHKYPLKKLGRREIDNLSLLKNIGQKIHSE